MAEYVRVRKPFAVYVGNRPVVYKAGKIVSTDDPGYATNVGNFELISEHEERRERNYRAATVERMTAAPGERREVSVPRSEEPTSQDNPAARVRAAQPVQVEDDSDDGLPERPADYAPKPTWVQYSLAVARSRGEETTADELDANYTKPELVSRYG
jgi:hypothetical protein